MKALIIEKDPETLKALETAFAIKGFTVTTAKSGAEAWNGLIDPRKWKKLPDLIITEMDLDGMKGIDLIRRLRSMTSIANVPIIAISDDAEQINRAILLGATSGFMKPVQSELVIQVAERLLAENKTFLPDPGLYLTAGRSVSAG